MSTELSDDNELLFRQIHPDFFDDGKPSSQPFWPTAKDDNKLSVDRSTLTTAEKSYLSYSFKTVAVYGLTVGEFREQDIPCIDDPLNNNSAHAFADYQAHHTSQQKKRGRLLQQVALKRGQLYPTPSP